MHVSIIFQILRFYICVKMLYLVLSAWLIALDIISSRSIHVVGNGSTSFLFMAEYNFIVYTYHIFFNHSSVDGHLGSLVILTIVSNAAMGLRVHVYVQVGVYIFFGCIPRNIIAWCYGSCIIRIWGNFHTVFYLGYLNLHSHNSVRGFLLLHILNNICYL